MGGKLFRIGSNGSEIFTSATRAGSGTTSLAGFASTGTSLAPKLSFVSHGSVFGFASSSTEGGGTTILNGIRTGGFVAGAAEPNAGATSVSRFTGVEFGVGASCGGERFGTDGPLEAGTLSGAGASV